MKTVCLVALLAPATAFVPPAQGRSNAALAAYQSEVGVTAPLGLFDPLGLIDGVDRARFDRLREVEIKHGRVSMLATVGYLVTAAGYRLPGLEGVPDGLASFPALLASDEGPSIVYSTLLTAGTFEITGLVRKELVEPEFPGDDRNGAIEYSGFNKLSEDEKFRKRNAEVNNGRAAMMGILGLMVHEELGVSLLPGGYLPGGGAASAAADAPLAVPAAVEAVVDAVADVVEAAADAAADAL